MVFDWTQSVAKSNFKLRLSLFSLDDSEISLWLEISSRLCMNYYSRFLSSENTLVNASALLFQPSAVGVVGTQLDLILSKVLRSGFF